VWFRRCFLAFVMIFPLQSMAGAFKVFPLNLQFDQGTKTASLKIVNTDERAVTVQLEGSVWKQDATTGEDGYDDTKDILFFPKIVKIEKGEERVVRIGFTGSFPAKGEKTYRLFIQELPPQTPTGGTLSFLLRLSIPLFVVSGELGAQPVLEKTSLSKGSVFLSVKNKGNAHAIVGAMEARGLGANNEELFRQEAQGWYVLPGVSRVFRIPLRDAPCDKAKTIAVRAEVGSAVLSGSAPVKALDCVAPREADAATKK